MKRKTLKLNKETIANLTVRQLRRAIGGVITDMDTMLNCYTEAMCGPTAAGPCDTAGNQTCQPELCIQSWPQYGCSGGPMCPHSGIGC